MGVTRTRIGSDYGPGGLLVISHRFEVGVGNMLIPSPGLTGRMDETALSLGTVKQAPMNPGYAGLRLIRWSDVLWRKQVSTV
jgi:hypothetical protein